MLKHLLSGSEGTVSKILYLIAVMAFLMPGSILAQDKSDVLISSDLMRLVQEQSNAAAANAGQSFVVDRTFTQMKDGKVLIRAIASTQCSSLIAELETLGLTDHSAAGAMVNGWLPIENVTKVKNCKHLRSIGIEYKPISNIGSVTSQGDTAQRSYLAREKYFIDGEGNKIGILSDSYNALGGEAAGVASGDLPGEGNPNGYTTPVEVLKDLAGGGLIDEGRGMAELIHDVAPGAELAFYTAFDGQADFANGIRALADAGSNIIVDDITYFAEPFFQDGVIAQAVDDVRKNNNVVYFASAGNSAGDSYESEFRGNSDTTLLSNPFSGAVYGNYILHDFDPGPGVKYTQKVTFPPGGSLRPALQWTDPFASNCEGCPGAESDIDMFFAIADDTGAILFESIGANQGGDPFEFISLTSSSPDPLEGWIIIAKYVDVPVNPDPQLIKYINFGSASIDEFFAPSPTTLGHANARGTLSVGATAYFNTREYGLDTPRINGFSSLGGIPIYYTKRGRLKKEPKVRRNPDFTSADGGNTTFFGGDFEGDGFPNFFGTSASAPHAAAGAALLQQVSPDPLSKRDVKRWFRKSSIDMDDPFTEGFDKGYDFRTGTGFIQVDVAIDKLVKKIGIKDLKLEANCTEDLNMVEFAVYNPNNFGVEYNYFIFQTGEKGSFVAFPGVTTFTTKAGRFFTTAKIWWEDERGHKEYEFESISKFRCRVYNYAMKCQAYPNPSSDGRYAMRFDNLENEEEVEMVVYNSQMQVVYRASGVAVNGGELNVNLGNLANGFYIAKVAGESFNQTIRLEKK